MSVARRNSVDVHHRVDPPVPASWTARSFISSIEEIIDEARNGRMFILVDDAERENEGDLIIPAQMVTPDAINFMATHGRGLICLALTKQRAASLRLEPMSRMNAPGMGTAFTVSIEAREGVTTGISAADRARTIAVATDASNSADAIVTPGHVFPLVAREGGVMVRAGHTEASVDIARLAGLIPAAVICEIMRDDGRMARVDDLMSFAEIQNIKVGTIRDLIMYRCRVDRDVTRISLRPFISRFGGSCQMATYQNRLTGTETVALIKGDIRPDTTTFFCTHHTSILNDMLGSEQLGACSLERVIHSMARSGQGVVILDEEGDATLAQILVDLGVGLVTLLNHHEQLYAALSDFGFELVKDNDDAR
jgi:3,4-dihydroxy 2-butanone 4-phosphate synthase/GTP cyclohydrolase II